jgi:hypothetical protein
MHLRVASLVVVGLRTKIDRVLVIEEHLVIIVIAKKVVLI